MIRNIHDYIKYSFWCKPDFEELLDNQINESDILIVGLSWCPWTQRAKKLVKEEYKIDPKILAGDVISNEYKINMLYCLCKKSKTTNVPQIWIKGNHIGSFEQLWKMHHRNQISEKINLKL
jgi:glutaredoxin